MNIGAELREARQRAGLSREAVSQRTKIQLAKIDALEANAFERLPEGIYLDGLIRAFATEVGLDGNEMVARLHRHNAIPLEDELAVTDEASRLPTAGATSLAQPPSPSATSVPEPELPLAADFFVNSTYVPTPQHPPSPVSTSVPTPEQPPSPVFTSVPERRGIGRFVIPLLALLAAIGLGAYLYDRTRPFVTREDIAAPAISHADTAANDAANASDAPGTAATDVIPADRPGSTEHHTEAELEKPAATPRPTPAPAAETPRARVDAPATTPAPVTGDLRTSPSEAAPEASATAANDAKDLSGLWRLSTHVESSSVRDYEGLELGYRLKLQQSGSRVAGEGMKTLENGREIAAFAQTPIIVSGTLEDGRLILTFTERGRRRETGGKMILQVHEDGVLRGRFSSSAAKSSGTAEARRPEG